MASGDKKREGAGNVRAVYRKILVGTDGSATAALAVDRAVEVAKAAGATLTLLTAASKARGETLLQREVERLGDAGVAIDTKVVDGDPAGALLDAAEHGGYDLLVVGNKGMTGVGRFFLGSVPNKVSHHVSCNLLIVRTT